MKYDRFTVKAREAISDAQNLAGKLGNPEIRPHHLLMTLLEQDKGAGLPHQARGHPRPVPARGGELLDQLPKVSGQARANLSRQTRDVIDAADKMARELGDTHVASEILFIGLGEVNDKPRQLLRDYGLTQDRLQEALKILRRARRSPARRPRASTSRWRSTPGT